MGAAAFMIRRLFSSILAFVLVAAFVPTAAPAQSPGFRPLTIENGKDTALGQYALRLAEPDDAEKPKMWQGPLTISNGSASCTADVSLVSAVFGDPHRNFFIVLTASGSNAIAHFIQLDSCAEKWPAIKRAAADVKVAGNRLSFLPVCEGGANNSPAHCTSARVYVLQNDTPPSYQRNASFQLTKKELGIGFVGEARVMDPRTPRAIVVH